MKSEQRHELKTNDLERLASQIGHASESYVQTHAKTLIVVVVAAVILGTGLVWWSNTGAKDSEAWRELAAANSSADFAALAAKYQGTSTGAWARLREAEMHLSSGVQLMFSNRDSGKSDLKKAQESFDKAIADYPKNEDVLERALYGAARTIEALSGKDTEAAIQAYEKVSKRFPDSVFKPPSDARVIALKTGTAQDFYGWFQAQSPKPADLQMPKDGLPPAPAPTKTDADKNAATATPSKGNETKSDATKTEPPKADAPKSDAVKQPDAAKKADAKPAAPELTLPESPPPKK